MPLTYQEQQLLQGATGRGAIQDLTARHNRAYSDGNRNAWIATFRHSGQRTVETASRSAICARPSTAARGSGW